MVFSIAQPAELLLLIACIGLASYRITRLITKDVIFDEPRSALIVWLAQLPDGGFRNTGLRSKLAYMLGCDFCVGVWVSLLLSVAVNFTYGVDGWLTFVIIWFASTGAQAKLSS